MVFFGFAFLMWSLIFFFAYAFLIMNNLAVSSLKYSNLGSNITTRGQCTNLKVSTFSDPFLVALVDFLFSSGTRLSEKNQFLLHCTHRSFLAGLVKRSQTNLFVYFRNWQDEAIVVSWFLLPFCLIVSNFDFWNV